MIVELMGLPGSGKTTFAKRLVGESDYVLIEIRGRFELLFYNCVFVLRHPLSFARQFVWLIRYRGNSAFWYTKFMNLFLVHNAKWMKAKKFPNAIIDQGHHQNVISLFDGVLSLEIINSYVKILPKPDILCFMLADEEARVKRLSGRGYSAREEFADAPRESWEEAREKNFESLFLMRGKLAYIAECISPGDESDVIKKLKNNRPWYFVMHIRMPTEKAHGLQVAKTLEALTSSGEYVSLWVPKRNESIGRDIAEYYGLRASIPLRRFASPQMLRFAPIFGALAYWLDALCFAFAVFFSRLPDDGLYYTRNAELVFAFKLRGREVFYEAHSWPNTKGALLAFLLRNVDGIVANSNGTAEAYRKKGFQNIHVIPNGVDLERYGDLPTKEEARNKLSLPTDKFVAMYVGAFYAWKGVPALLSAWAKHFGLDGSKALVLVGGTEEDLKKHGGYDEYSSCKNIQLVAHEPAARIPVWLAAADVLLLPNVPVTRESIKFTSPIKLFEYMASGRPIIASDLPSIREILDEECAVFSRPGDPDSILRALALLQNGQFAQKLSENARARAKQYSWGSRGKILTKALYG